MNTAALQIYSFLMRNEIEFIRYYHPAYTDRFQWKAVMKKSRLETVIPVCRVFRQKHTGLYLLSMKTEDTGFPVEDVTLVPATDVEIDAICSILHCQTHTLSPLGFIFDQEHQCRLRIDKTLYHAKAWCLSPCSDESSALLSPDTFLHQFLPTLPADILI